MIRFDTWFLFGWYYFESWPSDLLELFPLFSHFWKVFSILWQILWFFISPFLYVIRSPILTVSFLVQQGLVFLCCRILLFVLNCLNYRHSASLFLSQLALQFSSSSFHYNSIRSTGRTVLHRVKIEKIKHIEVDITRCTWNV